MRRLTYIVIFALFYLASCKTKTDVTNPDVELVVATQVNGVSQSGVRVLLFDNLADYTAAAITNSASKAVDSGNSVNGKITFHNLSTSKTYRMLATWTDTISQTAYNNLNSNYVLANNLNASSITYATVNLRSTDSYVGFWAASNANLPINIAIGNSNNRQDTEKVVLRTHSLSGSAPSISQILQYKRVNLGPGNYTFYAYDSLKTYYDIGSFSVDTGTTTMVQIMPDTSLELISFYFTGSAGENSIDLYPITVYLDHGDSLGAIKGTTASFTCGSAATANVITVARVKGAHTYAASSQSGLYRWQGQFNSAGCMVIKLD
jgi:hypothetical protein